MVVQLRVKATQVRHMSSEANCREMSILVRMCTKRASARLYGKLPTAHAQQIYEKQKQ
jgi:hypothetical protein